MKITFVHSPVIHYDQNYGTLFSPLWAFTLAAHVPDDWDIEIIDCVIHDSISIGRSDVFAFSGINQDIDSIRTTYDVLKRKYPGATFILGGPITWSLEQEGKLHLLEYFDYLFILDGERTLPQFLNRFVSGHDLLSERIIKAERFPMDNAREIRFDLYTDQADQYYGSVIEVSRGCPFLCEFCDIRVLPGNNTSNNKDPNLIVLEMDKYYKLGVTQFQFACDNFIGNVAWARECVDAIIDWKSRNDAKISIFTWLTINLANYPNLMEKMRYAGFSILFIGIESVNKNSLLETAKVQNDINLSQAVEIIQSYGFIIAPGFIFGFDSDSDTIFEDTLEFLRESGIIGGDPSFLTALPGTPLMKRMKDADRLIDEWENATVRVKISTNIQYLQDANFLINGFIGFIRNYVKSSFQYERYQNHIEKVIKSGNFVPIDGEGYGSPFEYLKLQLREPKNRRMLLLRALYLLYKPKNLFAVLRAWRITKRAAKQGYSFNSNFNYWVYVWTNIGLKYWGLKRSDFSIESVGADFNYSLLLDNQNDKTPNTQSVTRKRGEVKSLEQKRYTDRALKNLVDKRLSNNKNIENIISNNN
jgi:radical SAM superfamily enzyme YgiQ (UPF0313 family)